MNYDMSLHLINKNDNHNEISQIQVNPKNTDIIQPINTNKKYIIKQGNKIYRENDYLSKIWDLMNDNTFKQFYNNYLNEFTEIQVTMVYLNAYKNIENLYFKKFNRKIKKGEMMFLLKEIMKNNFMRKYFINDTSKKGLIQIDDNMMKYDLNNILNNNEFLLLQ